MRHKQHTPHNIRLLEAEIKTIRADGSALAWAYLVEAAREAGAVTDEEHLRLLEARHRVRRPHPRSRKLVVLCDRSAQYERCKAIYGKLEAVLERLKPPRLLHVEIDFRAQRATDRAVKKTINQQVERGRWDRLKGSAAVSKSIADAGFLHSYLAQVGLPRSVHAIPKRPDGTRDGNYIVEHGRLAFSVSAGVLHTKALSLPYGTRPRLIMADICTQGVRRKSRTIDLGNSAREYLRRLGLGWGGGGMGGYTHFRRQAQALAACSMRFSWNDGGRVVQYQGMPVESFDAWTTDDGIQRGLWPGELVLSRDFYESLLEHALPLEQAAYLSLSRSALAMDWYAFLCYYLPRIRRAAVWSWGELHAALGHGMSFKGFRRASIGGRTRGALPMAIDAYPAVRQMGSVELLGDGTGVRFRPTAPAIRRAAIRGASTHP